MELLVPETYTGTSVSGKYISVTAKDASNDIDCEAISAAVASIKATAKETLEDIGYQIRNVEAGKEVLSVEDKNLKPLIDDVAGWIDSLPQQGIYDTLDSAESYAKERHNELQKKYNAEAKAEKDRRLAE